MAHLVVHSSLRFTMGKNLKLSKTAVSKLQSGTKKSHEIIEGFLDDAKEPTSIWPDQGKTAQKVHGEGRTTTENQSHVTVHVWTQHTLDDRFFAYCRFHEIRVKHEVVEVFRSQDGDGKLQDKPGWKEVKSALRTFKHVESLKSEDPKKPSTSKKPKKK